MPASIRREVGALQDRPLLHAWSLSLDHPRTGERMSWVAPPPSDYLEIIRILGLHASLPEELRHHLQAGSVV